MGNDFNTNLYLNGIWEIAPTFKIQKEMPAESEFYPVPLTTCSGDAEAMIRAAIAYLFSARNSGMTLNRFFTPELVIRKSTARLKA